MFSPQSRTSDQPLHLRLIGSQEEVQFREDFFIVQIGERHLSNGIVDSGLLQLIHEPQTDPVQSSRVQNLFSTVAKVYERLTFQLI